MILHTLRVKNWRALREPVELAELSPGLNVIHGPNEAGKSTVMDAICRGFYDRHNTGGEGMKSRQPWGSSLGPTVEIEFTVGGQRYHLRKRFLEDKLCELSRWRDGGWERVAEGRRADEQILELAAGDATGRGMTKPEHWGLGQVLWACQGDATQLSVGESQQARLREALKITLDGTQGEAIEQTIGERYSAIYTSTGQLRRGEKNKAEVVRLQEEVELAEQQVDRLQQRMAAVEQDAHDLAAAEDEHEQTEQEMKQTQVDLKARRQQFEELAKQRRAYEKLEVEARAAEEAWKKINDRVQAIREADEAVEEAAGQVKALSKAGEQAQTRRKKAEAALRQAKEKRREAAEEQKRSEKAWAAADRLVRWLACEEALAKLRAQRDQAKSLQSQIAERQKELDQLAAPTPQQLKQLRTLQQQIERKQAELEAASLSVRIEPEQPLAMQVETDGEPAQSRQASEPMELTALSAMALDIEGVGRIVVRSGQSDATELAEQLEVLRQRWREGTAGLASQDLSQLEELQTRRQLLEQNLQNLRKQAEADDLPALESQLEELEHKRQALLAEDPNLEETDQTQAEAKRAQEEAQKRRDHAQAALEQAEAELEQAQEEQDAARDEATKQESQLSGARATLKVRQEEADRRRQEDGLSDEQRRKALLEARQQADAAQQRLERTAKPPTEDLTHDIEQLETQCQQLDQQLKDQISHISVLGSRIEQAGGEGLYSQLAEASERLDELQRHRDQAQLEADAVRLLWETIRRHKQEVFDATLKPVRQMVTATMQRLVGPRYEHVEFDEQLMPTAVQPKAQEDQAAVEHLSFGTREQLMLSVRLALARLLAQDGERQCVILDDPLVNADRARQRAALRILEEAASEAQILVFTCHPTAYQGLREATVFDLEAMVTAEMTSSNA